MMDDERSEFELQMMEGKWRESTTQGSGVLPGSLTVDVPPIFHFDTTTAPAPRWGQAYAKYNQEAAKTYGSVYIAGPMTGIHEYNFPAFHEAAARFRAAGWTVSNPAENHGGQTDLALQEYFAADLPQICTADAIALLPGWEKSKGAQIEVALAKHLGKRVLDAVTMEDYHEQGSPRYLDILVKMREGHIAKNTGYSPGADPWGNFRLSTKVGVEPWRGALVRLGDKFARVCSLALNPANDMIGENIGDTLYDLAAYALITLCLLEEEQGKELL